jgi:hypothetical protein
MPNFKGDLFGFVWFDPTRRKQYFQQHHYLTLSNQAKNGSDAVRYRMTIVTTEEFKMDMPCLNFQIFS